MYATYFGLRDNPFSITPDPGYVYLSPNHQEALAHLLYGTGENGGFVQLTGEVGTGKTTLIRTLLEQHLEKVDVALCLNPRLTVNEFLASVCDELQVPYPKDSHSLKPLLDALNAHLLKTHAQGRRTVLIVDEAQNLSREVLEQVRLLTNLETHRHKLLRIILVGQPELMRLLERRDLRQLAQRITARYHLLPLGRKETSAYLVHRIKVAGGREDLFTGAARRTVYRLTRGVPRPINIVCDRALLGAYGRNSRRVNSSIVRRAAREALGSPAVARPLRRLFLGTSLAGAVGAATALHLWPSSFPPLTTVSATLASTKNNPLPSNPIPVAEAPNSSVEPDPADPPEEKLSIQPAYNPVPALTEPEDRSTSVRVQRLFDTEESGDPLHRLLIIWGANPNALPEGPSACDEIRLGDLRCFATRGDWSDLRGYNRPALLQLMNAEGRMREVVLRSLDGDTATLNLPEGPAEIDISRLDSLWTGDYQMIWRLQTTDALIGPGSRGESVRWLRRRLAAAEAAPLSKEPLSEEFDALLMAQVRRFQITRNLVPDGWAGPLTLPHLNNLEPLPGTPFLVSAPSENR